MESKYQIGSVVYVVFPLYDGNEAFEVLGIQGVSSDGEIADGVEIAIAGYQYFVGETCFAEKFLIP